MTDDQPRVVAEITHRARQQCYRYPITDGKQTEQDVEALRAELEKNPTLGKPVQGAAGEALGLRTTRLEATSYRPALTITYAYDEPPQDAHDAPGLVRIALVTAVIIPRDGTAI
ncbi:hypothetical protein ACIRU3_07100 [Streptomyces sp. NPDC101151]|uniref:hypothetical protein n=1 Tax=Streptomyces sp. NPDC101151 TaxID=3366115 RepID=UPI00382123D1